MDLHDQISRIGSMAELDRLADPAVKTVKTLIRPGRLKDLLSGTWLGHPLHPVLTDVTIGSLTGATLLDFVGGRRGEHAADVLVGVGVLSALPTAAAGAADWSDTVGEDQRVGVAHAASNLLGISLYAMSFVARRRGARGTGKLLGLGGLVSMSIGGYLGGHLSFSRGIGVNYTFNEKTPEEWTDVVGEAELTDGKPLGVSVDDTRVLLYRKNDQFLAIGAVCTHAGGPLDEGSVDDESCTVECPWHQSVFNLRDGTVVHGPATSPSTSYEVRLDGGRVSVRARL